MTGGTAALWKDEDIADVLTRKAVAFLEKQKAGSPFFLFYSPHDIHEPMVPNPRFRGTSGCGWRGDVIHQLDWSVGEVLGTLDRLGLARHTLVIFTSDNGGAIKNTYDDGTNPLHALQPPNGQLRGSKGSLYEGGHRVPFLARWPARIPAGQKSAALLGHLDMIPTFAAIVGQTVPAGGAPDAVNVASALLGEKGAKGRDFLVLQNNNQAPLALRVGSWKVIQKPNGSTELYNLATDPAEEKDLNAAEPERLKALIAQLEAIKAKS